MEASTSDAARRGGYLNSSNFNSSANYGPRSSSSLVRRLTSQNFINDSCNASLDIAYIPWQTLSSDVNEKLRHGSVKINRSNRLEWAGTINEEATEKAPLLRQGSELCASTVTDAVQGGKLMVKSLIFARSSLPNHFLPVPLALAPPAQLPFRVELDQGPDPACLFAESLCQATRQVFPGCFA